MLHFAIATHGTATLLLSGVPQLEADVALAVAWFEAHAEGEYAPTHGGRGAQVRSVRRTRVK